jgi:methyl-accepting chemotaxis protein
MGLTLGRKLAIAVSLVAILVLGGTTVYLISAQSARYVEQVQTQLDRAHGTLTGLMDVATRGNQRLAAEMAENPEIQRLFATAASELGPIYENQRRLEEQQGEPVRITDPATLARIAANPSMTRLRNLTAPIYHQQHDAYNLGQFQFHLPPARSFFRVHSTDAADGGWTLGDFGDDLSSFRYTVLAANGSLGGYDQPQAVSGLEMGRGGPGLRGVVPVFYNGEHIGSVEFGGGIADPLNDAANRTGMKVTFFLTRQIVDDIAWRLASRVLEAEQGAGYGDFVYFDASDPDFGRALSAGVVGNLGSDGAAFGMKSEQVDGLSWRHATFPLTDFSGNTVGSVVLSLDETAALATARRTRLITAAIAILGVALLVFALVYALRYLVIRPVDDVAKTMALVSEGDFKARCEVFSKDEMGFVARQVNTTLDRVLTLIQSDEERLELQRDIQDLLVVVSDAADGDLTSEAKVTENIIGNVADAINLMFENISEVINKIRDSSVRVSSAANQIQAGSEALSAGSQRQLEDITNTTSAVQEMAINIEQVANNAEATAVASTRARESAEDGRAKVLEVVDGMEGIRSSVLSTLRQIKRLGDRSMEISTIVETITKIAAQTDMLALNAAIEAARAGEHGRGFSVVAEEVRRLAERSAEAAHEIEELVSAIQTETGESVRAMDQVTQEVEREVGIVNDAGQALDQIAEVSTKAADLVQEITLAAKQQVRGADEVVKAMGVVSDVSKQAVTGVEQTRQTTDSLVNLSEDLTNAVAEFKTQA